MSTIVQYNNLPSLSLNDKINFFTDLYTYIKSSIPISTALTKIVKYSQGTRIKELASGMLKSLDSGEDFSVSVLKFKKALGSVYCNLLSIGAQSGELPKITQDILNSLKKQRSAIRNVIKACAYPAILCVMLFIAALLLFFLIVPRMSANVKMVTGSVPENLQMLECIASVLANHWFLLLIIFCVSIWAFISFLKRLFKSGAGLRIPILGNIVRAYNLSVFSKIFAISYAAGVPVTSGLLLSSEAVSNNYIKNRLFKCSAMILKKPLSEVFALTGLFEPQMLSKIESGEMTGNLDVMLNEISADIDEVLETLVAAVLKMIEPLLIIIIAAFVIIYGSTIMSATNPLMYLSMIS